MKQEITSLKTAARQTGFLYFFFALAAIYNFMYVQPKIMVAGDMAATAKNMLANELLFRSGMAVAIMAHTLILLVVLFLYRLLKQVNNHQARIMVGLVMVGIPIAFLATVLEIAALSIIKGNLLTTLEARESQDLAFMLMRIGSYISQLVSLYWGLWLIPLGFLVYKSGFIPWLPGVLLIINGAGYMINSFAFILFPESQAIISKFIFPTYLVAEIPFILWLMIVGVKDHISITVISETDFSDKYSDPWRQNALLTKHE